MTQRLKAVRSSVDCTNPGFVLLIAISFGGIFLAVLKERMGSSKMFLSTVRSEECTKDESVWRWQGKMKWGVC